MAINIGAPATDRGAELGPGFTAIVLNTPAPHNGTLTTVELWAHGNLTDVKIGVLSRSGDNFTPRDYANIGNVTGGSKQTIPDLTIDVQAGDYIGIYYLTAAMDLDTSGGDGVYYTSGDQWDAGQQTYTLLANMIMSLGGWVETAPPAAAKRSYGFVIGT